MSILGVNQSSVLRIDVRRKTFVKVREPISDQPCCYKVLCVTSKSIYSSNLTFQKLPIAVGVFENVAISDRILRLQDFFKTGIKCHVMLTNNCSISFLWQVYVHLRHFYIHW